MIRPKPAPARPDPADIPEPEAESPPQEEDEPDTLSKATGWLRRSLNLGKKIDISPEPGSAVPPSGPTVEEEPTQAMSLFDIEEAERTAQQKPRTQRAPIRFVLKFSHGPQITYQVYLLQKA